MTPRQLARATGSASGGPADRRKQLGQWYTPTPLVEHLVGIVARSRPSAPRAVIDPACGDGRFLLAARAAFGPDVRLVGVDIDLHAVAAARRAVPGAEIVHADALAAGLLDRVGRASFDVVLGNPPFLNQLATSTSRGGRSRFGGGPYADAAAEFLALAAELVRPDGGQIALVLPQSLLTTRDAGAMRDAVTSRAAITHCWWSTTPIFDAAVHVCALVLTAGSSKGDVPRTFGPSFVSQPPVRLRTSWGRLLLEDEHDPSGDEDQGDEDAGDGAGSDVVRLGDVAAFAVDFRDQYYGLVGAVSDGADGPPLITSGLIDPGVCHWGARPVRFARRVFRTPRVDLTALTPSLQRWATRRLVPKVLVANQTRVIEAVTDPTGSWLPSVPVITCVPHDPRDLDAVATALSSRDATEWVRERAAGSGLSPRVVRLTPSLLSGVPWPSGVTRTAAG